jgi:heat shock protein HslJ
MRLVLPIIAGLFLAAILVAGCTTYTTTPQLLGSSWNLAYYVNSTGVYSPVISGTNVTATFGTNGQMSGSAGCNQYAATWSVNGNAITISTPTSTLVFCAEPPGLMDQESAYLADLPMAKSWTISSDTTTLSMYDASGKIILQYRSFPIPSKTSAY